MNLDTASLVPLPTQLQQHALADPDRVLIHHLQRDWTYGEVFGAAQSVATWLREAGVVAGDRVTIALPNGAAYAAAYFGTGLTGACAVTQDAAQSGRELSYAMEHSGSVCAILSEAARARLSDAGIPGTIRSVLSPPAPGIPGDGNWRESLDEVMNRRASHSSHAALETPAQIIYTSGTTGRPKGVVLSHRNLAANVASIIASLSLQRDDTAFAILPFSYSYGNSVLLTHVSRGGRIVVASDFVFWAEALDLMERQGATGFAGIPSSFAMLLGRSDFLKRPWPSLRYLTCAGGALPLPLVQRIRAALPHVSLYVMYGQTEASARLACLEPADLERKLGSSGRAIPGVELTIRDDNGAAVPAGEPGEIVAQGDNVMVGYWNDPAATAAVLRPDGLHTGDIGRMDAEGYLFVVGRRDDVIKSGGYRIGPQEIEDTVLQVSGVAEAGVAGIPDDILGAVPALFVVPRADDPTLPDRIRGHLAATLPRFKLPRSIHIVASLPRTGNGKLQRRRLLELLPGREPGSGVSNART